LCILVVGGDIGAPVVSLNRFSPCFWIVVTSLLCTIAGSAEVSSIPAARAGGPPAGRPDAGA
jgi:hypothetical protein